MPDHRAPEQVFQIRNLKQRFPDGAPAADAFGQWQYGRMADIIAFLEARLDEDEAESLDSLQHEPYPESWANILATRILLECAVKRKIIAHFNRIDWDYEPDGDQDYMEKFLFIIAEPYMDHPDYQPDWRL